MTRGTVGDVFAVLGSLSHIMQLEWRESFIIAECCCRKQIHDIKKKDFRAPLGVCSDFLISH